MNDSYSEMEAQQSLFDFADSVKQQLLSADEMFAALQQGTIRKWVENNRIENKSAMIQAQHLAQYFSMFANTSPDGGIVVIGVTKDVVFEGCLKLGIPKANELEKSGYNFCPDASYHYKQVPISRDKDNAADFVMAFRVKYHPTKVVCHIDGHAYHRVGDSLISMTPEQVRNLKDEKGEISLEKEPCRLNYPADFRKEAIAKFAIAVKASKRWHDGHTDEEVLKLEKLGKFENGVFIPFVSCALLFANDTREVSPGCRVNFLRFEGLLETSGGTWAPVKNEWLDGTVPELIVKTSEMLKSQLRTFSRRDPAGKFVTSPEYPEDAWHEAVVNALVHRSYGNGLKNAHVVVKMFEDRLVIESPGPFMPGVSPQNIYDVQLSRNPFLMAAMHHMDYVRAANEGTKRMKRLMHDMDLPDPEFVQEPVSFIKVRVTLRNKVNQRKQWVDADIAEWLGARIASTLNEDENRCLNFIAVNGRMNITDAMKVTNRNWNTAKKVLMRLVRRDILEHVHRFGAAFDRRDRQAYFKLRTKDEEPDA